jgi:hypothetical protein
MRTGRKIDWAVAGLVLFATLARGQAAHSSASGLGFDISSSGPIQASRVPAGEIVREIDDQRNGDRWLLVHDPSHPAGPGLLVLVSAASMDPKDPTARTDSHGLKLKSPAGTEVATPAPTPIIHGGDRVIVEENTPIVEARLEAVAMGPALAGSQFNARLSLGGRVVRAVAVEPGRAVLQTGIGQKEAGR